MQIKVNLKIFIIILLFIVTNQIELYGILMLFAFIHEMGHLIIGAILGFKPKDLSIKPIGMSISFSAPKQDYIIKIRKGNQLALKKIFVSLAGPLTNLILILLYYNFNISIFNIPRELAIYSNILIGIFNLIPIYPLDGGRIVKGILHIIIGFEKSIKYTQKISYGIIIFITILASILIIYFKNIAIFIIILYLWMLILKNNNSNMENVQFKYNKQLK